MPSRHIIGNQSSLLSSYHLPATKANSTRLMYTGSMDESFTHVSHACLSNLALSRLAACIAVDGRTSVQGGAAVNNTIATPKKAKRFAVQQKLTMPGVEPGIS
jgi:hypothetical protein